MRRVLHRRSPHRSRGGRAMAPQIDAGDQPPRLRHGEDRGRGRGVSHVEEAADPLLEDVELARPPWPGAGPPLVIDQASAKTRSASMVRNTIATRMKGISAGRVMWRNIVQPRAPSEGRPSRPAPAGCRRRARASRIRMMLPVCHPVCRLRRGRGTTSWKNSPIQFGRQQPEACRVNTLIGPTSGRAAYRRR